MLTLFRGDDFAFAEYNRKVCVRFNTFQDLTGWSAKFVLIDNVKQTNDITSRLWTFSYTAEETQKFPLGKTYGRLTIYDSTGQMRQMAVVEVEVVCQIPEPCIDGFIAISIDNVVADYNSIGNKPELNGKPIVGSHDSAYYGLVSSDDIRALISGEIPISGLLFTVTGDPDNYYKMHVVMRDDGAGKGNMVPAFALDPIPKDDLDSGSQS